MKKGNEMSVLSSAMSSSSTSTSDLLAGSSFGRSSEMKGWFNMKKLMFAAAVAAGMVGGLQAVESSVVG